MDKNKKYILNKFKYREMYTKYIMVELDIFPKLVQFHTASNLAECLPYIENGIILSPANKFKQIKEGLENKEYRGICIFQNGNTLLEELIQKEFANPDDVDDPADVSDADKFADFLQNREDMDGVYVFESATGEIMRVSKIQEASHQRLVSQIPSDFIFYAGFPETGKDYERMVRRKMGTKTRLAIELPQEFRNIHAYMIKCSGYTPLGMGIVAHFTQDGLKEKFFFRYDPESNGPFIDPEKKIIGVHRRYHRNDEGLLVRDKVNLVDPEALKDLHVYAAR